EADAQAYYPRYGVNSTHGAGLFLQLNAPASQLAGAVGEGWEPLMDVDAPHDPGLNPAGAQGSSIMTKAGQDMSNRNAAVLAFTYCDGLFLLGSAVKAGAVSQDTIRKGIDAIGTTYASPLTFATRLKHGEHDGVYRGRDFAYQSSCGCFA